MLWPKHHVTVCKGPFTLYDYDFANSALLATLQKLVPTQKMAVHEVAFPFAITERRLRSIHMIVAIIDAPYRHPQYLGFVFFFAEYN